MIVLGKNHGADIEYLKENKIKYILAEELENMGALRNKGLEQVKTEWWLYFAIDDELLPHACEEIVNTNADAVSIKFDVIDINGKVIKDQQSPHFETISDLDKWKSMWGGYTAVKGNTDLRYREDIEVPNLSLHFEMFRRNLNVVKSNTILVKHLRREDSHHFRSIKDGTRANSVEAIEKQKEEVKKEKEKKLMERLYLVKANKEWEENKILCNDFTPKKVVKEGEEWTVDGLRLEILLGNNKLKRALVEVVEEIDTKILSDITEIEVEDKKEISKKQTNKTTKKKQVKSK